MSLLYACGVACMCLSVWGVIQLTLMGVFYHIEVVQLIEDVEQHHAKDYKDFVKKTKENYKATALNCWIVAGIYAVTLLLSCACMQIGKKKDSEAATRFEDDEIVCLPILPKDPQPVAAEAKKTKLPKFTKQKKAPKSAKEKKPPKPEEEKNKPILPTIPSSPKKKRRSARDKTIIIV